MIRKHGIKSKSTGSKANRKLTISKLTVRTPRNRQADVAQIFPTNPYNTARSRQTPEIIRGYLKDAQMRVRNNFRVQNFGLTKSSSPGIFILPSSVKIVIL